MRAVERTIWLAVVLLLFVRSLYVETHPQPIHLENCKMRTDGRIVVVADCPDGRYLRFQVGG